MLRLSHFWFTLMAAVLPFGVMQAELSSKNNTPQGDVVIQWNRAALEAIRTNKTPPPAAARDLAILHLAIFDAVNAIEQRYQPYLGKAQGLPGASSEVAAISAANWVLTGLYPSQVSDFDELMTSELRNIPDSPAKRDGIIVGREAAKAMLALRAKDNSGRQATYSVGKNPGQWKPTLGQKSQPLLAHWSGVTPFALKKPAQFRPPPPLDHQSEGYAADINEVKEIGGKQSDQRTPEQTLIAQFWDEGPGTVTPPGQWNQIATAVVEQKGNGLLENARLFALLNMALADSGIAAWECKYRYNSLRPETAIRDPKATKNSEIVMEPGWASLLKCPHSPEYVSGNSAYSAAAAVVLSTLLGDDNRFTIGSDAKPGTTRSFNSFSQAAKEAGLSRIYGGVLTNRGNETGEQLGRDVAHYVVDGFLGSPESNQTNNR